MNQLHKYWRSILVRGVVAIIFGLIALFMPGLTLGFLVLLIGAFFLVDGALAFFVGLFSKSGELLIEGLIGALIGVFMFFYTVQAIVVLVILIALWAILTGAAEIIAAIALRRYVAHEVWLLIAGIVSVAFGIIVFVNPVDSGIAITWVIGIYALVFGISLTALAMRVKNYKPRSVPGGKKKRK